MTNLRRKGESSDHLTEVRTVLSRARTGMQKMYGMAAYIKREPDGMFVEQFSDPDSEEMISDLKKVVLILEKWDKR